MQKLLLLLLCLPQVLLAGYEVLSITDAAGLDSAVVRVGDVVEFQIRLNTDGTLISGFQCFMNFDETIVEPVRYNESDNGWFQDLHLFEGSVLFADDHDTRFPDNPLPGHQLDWCYQTGVGDPRPTFAANGVACKFKLRFLQPVQGYEIRFDHDNPNFRNTLFWEGQSAVEESFYREYSLIVNATGVNLDPLPDVWLTTNSPVDSLDLYSYLDMPDEIADSSVTFSWDILDAMDVCTIDTLRDATHFWLQFAALDGARETRVEVSAHVYGATAMDTMRVLRGNPPMIDDTVSTSDPFIAWAEDDSLTISLDSYVLAGEDPPELLTWSVPHYEGELSVEVDEDHFAHFLSPPDWNGRDSLWLKVEDTIGMADSARFVALVWSVNDAPRLSLPDTLGLPPDGPYDVALDTLVLDVDHLDSALFWSISGDTSAVAARLDPVSRHLELEVQQGTPLGYIAEFAIMVQDPDAAEGVGTLRIEVVSHPPVWQSLPDLVFQAHETPQFGLDPFLSDADDPNTSLTLWLEGAQRLLLSLNAQTHVLQVEALPSFVGGEIIQIFAEDPDGHVASTDLRLIVYQGASPVVALVPDLIILPGATDSSLILDEYVWDLDTPASSMTWDFLHNGTFTLELRPEDRRLFVTAPDAISTIDLVSYSATDPQGHQGEDLGWVAVLDPAGSPLLLAPETIYMHTGSIDSSITVDDYAYDSDHGIWDLTWSISQGSTVSAEIRESDHRLLLTSSWATGEDLLTLTVEDPAQNTAHTLVRVIVTSGDAPIVSEFAPRWVIAGQNDTLHSLSSWVYDPDQGDQISWSFIDPSSTGIVTTFFPEQDLAVIHTDSTHVGTDLLGVIATDLEQNSGMAWLELHSVENQAPRLETGILPNPALPSWLDLLLMSDEPLRSLTVWGANNGTYLPFNLRSQGEKDIWMGEWRPDGEAETLYFRAYDLPNIPQVAGNVTLDSLVLAGAQLTSPGDQFISADGLLEVRLLGGEPGAKVLRSLPSSDEERSYQLIGLSGARLMMTYPRGWTLETKGGGQWIPQESDACAAGRQSLLEAHVLSGGRLDMRLREGVLPDRLHLGTPWPNPFNPVVHLTLELPSEGLAEAVVFDLLGRQVRTLMRGTLPAGYHDLMWDARDSDGQSVASGVYVLHLRHPDGNRSQKLVLIR